jgi:uncharacterized protein (DUF433 family)
MMTRKEKGVTVPEDQRFTLPLYSTAEASRYLGVSDSTFRTWSQGYRRSSVVRGESRSAPVVTRVSGLTRGAASIPFIGLAEGLVLAGIRKSGVPLQRIRPALDQLRSEFGFDHVLASRRLYSDGAEVLYDFGRLTNDTEDASALRQLVVVRHGQRVFTAVVEQYLRQIEFSADGFAQVVRLPQYGSANVVADPRRGFGHPTFQRGGARVEDVLSLFWAGESLATVSSEYGVPEMNLRTQSAQPLALRRHERESGLAAARLHRPKPRPNRCAPTAESRRGRADHPGRTLWRPGRADREAIHQMTAQERLRRRPTPPPSADATPALTRAARR